MRLRSTSRRCIESYQQDVGRRQRAEQVLQVRTVLDRRGHQEQGIATRWNESATNSTCSNAAASSRPGVHARERLDFECGIRVIVGFEQAHQRRHQGGLAGSWRAGQ
jgi:hypothetical protein